MDAAPPLVPGDTHSEDVWTKRKLLSAAHKEVAFRGHDQLIWNHISAKAGDRILITPGDRMWCQVEPETLKLSSTNVTADILHAAVYAVGRHTAVVHLHSPAVVAVACLEAGFKPPKGSEF